MVGWATVASIIVFTCAKRASMLALAFAAPVGAAGATTTTELLILIAMPNIS
jgi:hypothetical protein